MVHADERSGFGEAVALNGGVAQRGPELFDVGGQRSAAGDRSPEAPPELAPDCAESPPAPEKMLAHRILRVALEFLHAATGFQTAEYMIAQRFEQTRNRDEQRHSFALDRADDFSGIERIEKDRRGAENLRKKNAEQLAENVAERQQFRNFSGWNHFS